MIEWGLALLVLVWRWGGSKPRSSFAYTERSLTQSSFAYTERMLTQCWYQIRSSWPNYINKSIDAGTLFLSRLTLGNAIWRQLTNFEILALRRVVSLIIGLQDKTHRIFKWPLWAEATSGGSSLLEFWLAIQLLVAMSARHIITPNLHIWCI